tara:strand:- start:296 stop:481 length:186 start_codon:yes stop_codon:yes gene_type:complete
MQGKYSIKKFNGDDQYSWAVFHAADVKGKQSPILYNEAKPVICGLDRSEARYHKECLEAMV